MSVKAEKIAKIKLMSRGEKFMKKKIIRIGIIILILHFISFSPVLSMSTINQHAAADVGHQPMFFYEISQWIEWRVIYIFDLIIRIVGKWF